MNLFEKNVLKTIKKYNMITSDDNILVGLSGGADSCALLYSLKSLSKDMGFTVSAAHLNHGIRGSEAVRDLEFSMQLSKTMHIDFYSKTVDVPGFADERNISEEMAGRELRYEFFGDLCRKHGFSKIAVAHNKNDSAETVLMNLVRGSGSRGLSGITPVNHNIIRPLIETERADIENYLHTKNIDYITDSTNCEDIYTRNILRNQVFPTLCKVNTNALNNIANCSDIISDEHEFLCEYTQNLGALSIQGNKVHIDLPLFKKQHIAIKRILVLEAIRALNGNTLNFFGSHLQSIISGSKTGSVITLPCKVTVIFEHDQILFTKEEYNIHEYEYNVTLPGKLTLKETGISYNFEFVHEMIHANNVQYINMDYNESSQVILRTRRDGDTFIPYGMNGMKKIKNFLIDNKIPNHKKNNYPLLLINSDIAAVLGLRISEKYKVNKDTQKILKITISGGKNE